MGLDLGFGEHERSTGQIAEDMIFHNGKIITVDDHGFNSQVGTIAQAMQVEDGKIVQLGANAEILALAGPDTQVMDLKGRMVLPGFILTHEHAWFALASLLQQRTHLP